MSVSFAGASRRRRVVTAVVAVLVLAAVALALAACGSSNSGSSGSSSSPSTSSLHSLLPATIVSAGQIRVASDIPYMPWEGYVGTSTQPTGFDYELSQALGTALGIKVAFTETPFDSIILAIQGGKRDMAMSDMYDAADREKVLTFVDYALDGTSIVVLKGNPKGVTNLNSLAGKTVACESGTTQQALLTSLNKSFASSGQKQMTILALPNQPAALLAVKSGRAVGDLTDHSTAEYNAKTAGNGTLYEVVSDPAAPNGYVPQMVGIGILKSNTQLVTAVQKALQSLIDNGTYKTIIDKYGLLPVTSAQINAGPAYAKAHASIGAS
jgi:polar amino acid transport system substrate-binding protein